MATLPKTIVRDKTKALANNMTPNDPSISIQLRRIGESLMQHHAQVEQVKISTAQRATMNKTQQKKLHSVVRMPGKHNNSRVKFNEDISNVGNFSPRSGRPLEKHLTEYQVGEQPSHSEKGGSPLLAGRDTIALHDTDCFAVTLDNAEHLQEMQLKVKASESQSAESEGLSE